MRYSLILFVPFFSIFILSCQSKTETTGNIASNDPVTASDSLIIRNDELISDPFGLGERPLTYLSSEMPIDTIEVIPNFEESIEEDTTENLPTGNYYRLSYKDNYFSVYKRADGTEFFTYAAVVTDDFLVHKELYLGMSKTDFIKKLNIPTITSLPTYLIITDTEDYNHLQFEFKNDKLVKIIYDGYLD